MTVQANIRAANEARQRVKEHCMAFKIIETTNHLTVVFPCGFSLDGVRVSMANGIVWACNKAIEKMEQTWKAN